MRTIKYWATKWLVPWQSQRKNEVWRFILDIPHCLYWSVVPSRQALNEVLRRGHAGGGMSDGLIWESFEVDETEYQEILHQWKTTDLRNILGFNPDSVPDLSFIYDEEIMKIAGQLDYLRKSREKYGDYFWSKAKHHSQCETLFQRLKRRLGISR